MIFVIESNIKFSVEDLYVKTITVFLADFVCVICV